MGDYGAFGDFCGYPDVSADGGVVADYGFFSEDGGVGVDDYVVAYGGVPFYAFNEVAFFVFGKTKGT